ncbi:hypothetical protein ACA910_021732 [Epithemia clementina (nom. ined.)]
MSLNKPNGRNSGNNLTDDGSERSIEWIETKRPIAAPSLFPSFVVASKTRETKRNNSRPSLNESCRLFSSAPVPDTELSLSAQQSEDRCAEQPRQCDKGKEERSLSNREDKTSPRVCPNVNREVIDLVSSAEDDSTCADNSEIDRVIAKKRKAQHCPPHRTAHQSTDMIDLSESSQSKTVGMKRIREDNSLPDQSSNNNCKHERFPSDVGSNTTNIEPLLSDTRRKRMALESLATDPVAKLDHSGNTIGIILPSVAVVEDKGKLATKPVSCALSSSGPGENQALPRVQPSQEEATKQPPLLTIVKSSVAAQASGMEVNVAKSSLPAQNSQGSSPSGNPKQLDSCKLIKAASPLPPNLQLAQSQLSCLKQVRAVDMYDVDSSDDEQATRIEKLALHGTSLVERQHPQKLSGKEVPIGNKAAEQDKGSCCHDDSRSLNRSTESKNQEERSMQVEPFGKSISAAAVLNEDAHCDDGYRSPVQGCGNSTVRRNLTYQSLAKETSKKTEITECASNHGGFSSPKRDQALNAREYRCLSVSLNNNGPTFSNAVNTCPWSPGKVARLQETDSVERDCFTHEEKQEGAVQSELLPSGSESRERTISHKKPMNIERPLLETIVFGTDLHEQTSCAFDDDSSVDECQDLSTVPGSLYSNDSESEGSASGCCTPVKPTSVKSGNTASRNQQEKVQRSRDLAVTDTVIPPTMCLVEHLSKIEYDVNGRPVWTLVVHNDDGTLYRFKIHVEESKIAGGGLGAFITYLGSMHLDPKVKEQHDGALSERTYYEPDTMGKLEFVRGDGQQATLKLTGDDLHGNDNNPYWPSTLIPWEIKMVVPGQKQPKTVSVRITGELIHQDPDFEELKRRADKHGNGFGYLGLLLDSDFAPGSKAFKVRDRSIRIGRYGPLQKQDRKPDGFFNCKSFIFSLEPADYCFDVQERYCANGEPQVIDISDDVTGLPHDAARQSLPMYVNEVGHGLDRKQNIFAVGDNEERSIEYFFVLPDGMSLQVGDCIELLTNYYDSYERNRERKGYGLKNLYRGKPSDQDYASYLENRLDERNLILNLTATFSMATVDIMENVKDSMYEPIQDLLEKFIATGNCNLLSSLQLVALRRIFWLKRRFETMAKRWEETIGSNLPLLDARVPALAGCQEVISTISCHDFILRKALWDSRKLGGDRSRTISDIVKLEAVEEACFALRARVVQPFSASLWCKVACDLLRKLSSLVAQHLWPVELSTNRDEVKTAQKCLLEDLMTAGNEAAQQIRSVAKGGNLSEIAFASGLREDMVMLEPTPETLNCDIKMLLVEQSATPKSYIATLLAIRMHQNVGKHVSAVASLDHKEQFIMAKCSCDGVDVQSDLSDLVSVPRSTSKLASCPHDVNVSWYIIWQVLYIVEAFAASYCGVNDTLQALCDRLQVPIKAAEFAVSRGIKPKSENFKGFCRPKQKIRIQKVLDLPRFVELNRESPPKNCSSTSNITRTHKPLDRKASTGAISNTSVSLQLPSTEPSPAKKPPALLVWEGKPDEPLEGGWPEGWTKKIFQRQSGSTKGSTDRYWYSRKNFKFRSMIEVRRFLALLQSLNGDETAAHGAFKQGRSIKSLAAQSKSASTAPGNSNQGKRASLAVATAAQVPKENRGSSGVTDLQNKPQTCRAKAAPRSTAGSQKILHSPTPQPTSSAGMGLLSLGNHQTDKPLDALQSCSLYSGSNIPRTAFAIGATTSDFVAMGSLGMTHTQTTPSYPNSTANQATAHSKLPNNPTLLNQRAVNSYNNHSQAGSHPFITTHSDNRGVSYNDNQAHTFPACPRPYGINPWLPPSMPSGSNPSFSRFPGP